LTGSDQFKPAAVILAGGKSSRLGPGSKAMIDLAGMTMIQYVVDRLETQASPILISVQDDPSEVVVSGLLNIPDLVQRHRGPLTGLCSAMQHVKETSDGQWLLMCPCDAPFVPLDLAIRLYDEALKDDAPVSVVRYENVVQPTFSLWNMSVFQQVHEAVFTAGRGGLMSMLDLIPHTRVDWEQGNIPPFFNVNSAADLVIAERLLDGGKPGN
jgi:molybdopterin-guanine dinucleotide biosynthesis protein A